MAAQIIDGKAVSAKVKEEVRQEIEREGLDVGLAVVIVGDDPASRVYVNNKKKACEVCGIKSYEYALPAETTEEQLMELIDTLNADSKVNGILVQLPLPKHLNEEAVIARISPLKDVDAFSASNVGKIMIGNYAFLPCTPAGCMELIHSTGVDVSGKECVVIGRSNIVGKPMAMLLLHENGTVTICHSRTKNLKEVCARADILVAAVGIPGFVTGDMEARRGSHRRWNQPQRRGQALRRLRIRRVRRKGFIYHACSRRRRSHDHRNADEEYRDGKAHTVQMRNQAKPFLRNAVILTIALVIVGLMMNSWGVVQILIMVLLAVLTAGQWLLYFYMRKH